LRSLGAGKYAIEEAVKKLQKSDCYISWEEELRYFMFRYEEYLGRVGERATLYSATHSPLVEPDGRISRIRLS